MYFKITFSLLLALFAQNLAAQTQLGFAVAYGGQEFLHVNYHHQAYLLKAQLRRPLFRSKPTQLVLGLSPQCGWHRYRPVDSFPDYQSAYEYGLELSIALQYRQPSAPIETFLSFRIGPQYVAGLPSRQAAGLVFSSGFMLGFNYWWRPKMGLSLRTGFRHWSNAGLQQPNGGIDHLLLELGFLWNRS